MNRIICKPTLNAAHVFRAALVKAKATLNHRVASPCQGLRAFTSPTQSLFTNVKDESPSSLLVSLFGLLSQIF